jgi:hypothetical protein
MPDPKVQAGTTAVRKQASECGLTVSHAAVIYVKSIGGGIKAFLGNLSSLFLVSGNASSKQVHLVTNYFDDENYD